MKLGFLSDLHLDWNVVNIHHGVSSIVEACRDEQVDKLFLVGDTSSSASDTEFVIELLNEHIPTYYILGNHEYWTVNYEQAQESKNKYYINNKAIEIKEDVVVIGIDGMYDYSFVTEYKGNHKHAVTDVKELKLHGLFNFDLSKHKLSLEDFYIMYGNLERMLKEHEGKKIIVINHYVPKFDFLVYKDPMWNSMNAFMGSPAYGDLYEEYGVDYAIFGHTHHSFNAIIEGVNYVCSPVGYKRMEFDETFEERVKSKLFVINL